ncbi:MAG: hypothetical protein WCI89_01815 [bacterium]
MADFVYNLVLHPLHSLGFVLSFVAAFGFLIFLRGFSSGAGHLFTIDHHDHHLSDARLRAIWGVIIMLDVFMLWVAIRTLAALFGGPPINIPLTETIVALYAIWQLLAWWLLPPAPKGH